MYTKGFEVQNMIVDSEWLGSPTGFAQNRQEPDSPLGSLLSISPNDALILSPLKSILLQ